MRRSAATRLEQLEAREQLRWWTTLDAWRRLPDAQRGDPPALVLVAVIDFLASHGRCPTQDWRLLHTPTDALDAATTARLRQEGDAANTALMTWFRTFRPTGGHHHADP